VLSWTRKHRSLPEEKRVQRGDVGPFRFRVFICTANIAGPKIPARNGSVGDISADLHALAAA